MLGRFSIDFQLTRGFSAKGFFCSVFLLLVLFNYVKSENEPNQIAKESKASNFALNQTQELEEYVWKNMFESILTDLIYLTLSFQMTQIALKHVTITWLEELAESWFGEL